jgi:hypothetical protein
MPGLVLRYIVVASCFETLGERFTNRSCATLEGKSAPLTVYRFPHRKVGTAQQDTLRLVSMVIVPGSTAGSRVLTVIF